MRKLAPALAALAAGALLLTGCSSSASNDADTNTGSNATSVAPLADAVPEAFKGETLIVTTGANNPPLYFTEADGTYTGLTREIAEAAAELLGLELEVQSLGFDTVIPGLQAGTIDVGIYGVDVTAERVELIDMVSYFSGGHSIMTYDNALDLADDPAALCGLQLGGIAGSSWVQTFTDLSTEVCAADQPIVAMEFKDQAGANLAAQSGQIDGAVIASIAGGYAVSQDDSWSLTGPTVAVKPVGMAFTKGSGLAEAFQVALDELMANGTYEEIFASYGVEAQMIPAAELNNPDLAKLNNV